MNLGQKSLNCELAEKQKSGFLEAMKYFVLLAGLFILIFQLESSAFANSQVPCISIDEFLEKTLKISEFILQSQKLSQIRCKTKLGGYFVMSFERLDGGCSDISIKYEISSIHFSACYVFAQEPDQLIVDEDTAVVFNFTFIGKYPLNISYEFFRDKEDVLKSFDVSISTIQCK